jgi:hypothetical protein
MRDLAGTGFTVLDGRDCAHGRRLWGRQRAALILAANLAGDLATAAATRQWTDLAGAAAEALVLAWVMAPGTRRTFTARRQEPEGAWRS